MADRNLNQDEAFVAATAERLLGTRPTAIEGIPAGLGARRFYRLTLPALTGLAAENEEHRAKWPKRIIARLEPAKSAPEADPGADALPAEALWLSEPPLEPLRSVLEKEGLPVPRSYGYDLEAGIDLLEDVGDRTLLDLEGADRDRAYHAAGELIVRLQQFDPAPEDRARLPAFQRTFDDALLRTKAWKFKHWAWPGLLGRPPNAAETRAIDAGFSAIGDLVRDAPKRLAHRDFKGENLHCVDRPGGTQLVMIDLQGAFLAPPEYDALCLLRDLQVDLEERFVVSLRDEILEGLPGRESSDDKIRRFDALTLVRLAKDVSHVLDAGYRRGDRRRWHEIPRGLKLLGEVAERLQSTFSDIRALNDVIAALTQSPLPADIAKARRGS